MLSWLHLPSLWIPFVIERSERHNQCKFLFWFVRFATPFQPIDQTGMLSLFVFVFHLIRYVYYITNLVILSPEYGRTLKIAYFRLIGDERYTIEKESDKRSLDQVFNRVVYQTHLPTTIARGCAGFLSWDEERIRLISACRPVIIRECEKGGPDLRRSRKLLKMYDGIWTWLAALRF